MFRVRQAAFLVTLGLIWAALGIGQAGAQRMEGDRAVADGLYEAEVAVGSQNESERRAAFGRALAQVLAKLSGDNAIASRPGVGQELRRAEAYVTGYDYRQDEGTAASGAPSFQTTLVVRFDQDAVDAVAGALGLPVWPEPRVQPVLWLAIDDGSGPRLVGLEHNTVARPILRRAEQRGFGLGLPRGNAAEQAAVGAIWRGDTAAIARLSSRYSSPAQLIGKLSRGGEGWVAEWVLVDSSRTLSNWSTTDLAANEVMAGGADGAAAALVQRYARAPEVAPAGWRQVRFVGILGAADYVRLSGYLQGLSVVRDIRPVGAAGDSVVYELDLLTGLPGFRRLADQRVLAEMPGGDDAQTPVFRLQR